MTTLEEERRALAAASDVLRTLQERLEATEQESAQVEQQLRILEKELAVDVERREVAEREVADLQILLDATPAEAKVELFPRLEALRGEALGEPPWGAGEARAGACGIRLADAGAGKAGRRFGDDFTVALALGSFVCACPSTSCSPRSSSCL